MTEARSSPADSRVTPVFQDSGGTLRPGIRKETPQSKGAK